MSGPAAKGWCPSLFAPMRAADGWLARVKPPGGVLSVAGAKCVAAAAERFGNGTIELTSRANLQVRGLADEGIGPFAAAIVGAGLADADPEREARRRVIHPPLAGADPAAPRDAGRFAAEIEAALAGDPRLADLPAKFAVAVDGGGVLTLGGTGADVVVAWVDGRWLAAPAGVDGAAEVADAEAVARLARAFLEVAGLEVSERGAARPRRMRALVGAIGSAALFAAARLDRVAEMEPRAKPQAIGWLAYGDGRRGAFGLGLPFGTMSAAALAGIATIAGEWGDGSLRLTPWRAMALPGVEAAEAPALAAQADRLGLIAEPADPRRAVSACIGRAGCAAAAVDARADAAMLLRRELKIAVHVSGCSKGCGQAEAAPVTLVGEDGRYGLVRDGRAGDAPSVRGLTMAEAMDAIGAGA
jgi:precorrin-3B synthase